MKKHTAPTLTAHTTIQQAVRKMLERSFYSAVITFTQSAVCMVIWTFMGNISQLFTSHCCNGYCSTYVVFIQQTETSFLDTLHEA